MDFPEPLYESYHFAHRPRMCLVCAKNEASSVLRTVDREVVPICAKCSAEWNFHGYEILKRIRPGRLACRALLFQLLHPRSSLLATWRDAQALRRWAEKMKRWMKRI